MATKITLTNGNVLEAPEPKAADIVAFERKFKLGAGELAEHPHVEHALFLAWNALKRVGAYVEDFERFISEVDDFENEDDASPLDSAQPSTNS